MSSDLPETKYRFLVLGGCGFIGRHMVDYILTNNIALKIRVADKIPPRLAYLNKRHWKVFEDPLVEFINVNFCNKTSLGKVFDDKEPFDYVINCAGETRYGMMSEVYMECVVNLSTSCAKLAAKQNVKRFVEISSGQMASYEKVRHREDHPISPWSVISQSKAIVEKRLEEIEGLRYTIVRPAIVYGKGERVNLMPKLILYSIAHGKVVRAPKEEPYIVYWNTVHVEDTCRAVWHLSTREDSVRQIYNIVDNNNTTLNDIERIASQVFGFQIHYYETEETLAQHIQILKNALVDMVSFPFKIVRDIRVFMTSGRAEELAYFLRTFGDEDSRKLRKELDLVNCEVTKIWQSLLKNHGIASTPLSPYMYMEYALSLHTHLDGSKLEKTGFQFKHPTFTKELIQEVIIDYEEMKLFPKGLRSLH